MLGPVGVGADQRPARAARPARTRFPYLGCAVGSWGKGPPLQRLVKGRTPTARDAADVAPREQTQATL